MKYSLEFIENNYHSYYIEHKDYWESRRNNRDKLTLLQARFYYRWFTNKYTNYDKICFHIKEF